MITKNLFKRIITSVLLILLLILMYNSNKVMLISLIFISIISWLEFNKLFSKFLKKEKSKIYLLNFITFIYLSFFVLLILKIGDSQKVYFFYAVIISISSDIGGYVVGKTFKGRKLTKISPNKTISGSIGSFVFSFSIIPFFINYYNDINLYQIILITFIISLTSQLGDLMLSYLKRKSKAKDTGNFLPGHGGILDRIDGILFAAPVGVFLFILFL